MEKKLFGWLLVGLLVFIGGCATQSGLTPVAEKHTNNKAVQERCYTDMGHDVCY